MAKIAMLGSGFIGRFYTDSLHGLRSKDRVVAVYSRNGDNAQKFADDYGVSFSTTDMEAAIAHEDVEVVCIALPNNLHHEAVMYCVKHKKAVICTKPLGRTAAEALEMLEAVEKAGIFGGYLEDLCYTPKFLKSLQTIKEGALGKILWARSRETHPGPHSDWFWDKAQSGGGAILDLACHCIEIGRNYIGKDVRPVEVMCWSATQVKPIDAEDHAIGLVKYATGAISQFEVSWAFRGGLDLRDEVMGTEGTIWVNNFLRTGLEMFVSGQGNGGYVAEKSESSSGWIFPVGDELHELGYNAMFADMFNSWEKGTDAAESFYDGYVVNAIIDAAYKSAQTRQWQPVELKVWRGKTEVEPISAFKEYDADHYFLTQEVTHDGRNVVVVKDKKTGEIKRFDI
ncbi:MAG: Gfo/Idh/MocA family oxidoreductase [Saprospiraceae bacterium]|nr:Gfo/Idh/MocA family oxidoreductase [Saprospiraceae bacterium]